MAINVPVAQSEITVGDFGKPVADVINGLMFPTWRALTLGVGVTAWGGLTPSVSMAGRLCAFSGTLGVPAGSPINFSLWTFPSGVAFTVNRNMLLISQYGPLAVWLDSSTNQARLGAAVPNGGWIGIDGQFQYVS